MTTERIENMLASITEQLDRIEVQTRVCDMPEDMAHWVRESARHGAFQVFNIMYGANPASAMQLQTTANPDGTFRMEIVDTNGRTMWRALLRPPSLRGTKHIEAGLWPRRESDE